MISAGHLLYIVYFIFKCEIFVFFFIRKLKIK